MGYKPRLVGIKVLQAYLENNQQLIMDLAEYGKANVGVLDSVKMVLGLYQYPN